MKDMETPVQPSSTASPRWPRSLLISLGFNIVGILLLCGLGLYTFMLNVDLGETSRRVTKEIAARQQTERYLVETRNRLNQSLEEIAQLKTQLEYKPSEFQMGTASKPTMPMAVHFRSSFLGKGVVAVLENTSDRSLTVVMNVRNPTLARLRRFTVDIEPHASEDFGHLEGWQFASGDELTLFHNNFNALRVVVP